MTTYSRRQLEAMGLPFGEGATRVVFETPMHRTLLAGLGGGGGATESKVTNYNIPDWLRPQTEALIGAATQETFQTSPDGEILGVKPFTPYSANPQDYTAGFSPMQERAFGTMANTQYSPTQAGTDSFGGYQDAYRAGIPGMNTPMMDASGLQVRAPTMDVSGLQVRAPTIDASAMNVNTPTVENTGGVNLNLDPTQITVGTFDDYYSPYMQRVTDVRKDAATTDAQKANMVNNLAASRQGTYGGARQLLAQTEREANLQDVMENIQATGSQSAYENAQQALQYYTGAREGARVSDNQLNTQAAIESARIQSQRAQLQAQIAAQMEQMRGHNALAIAQGNAGYQFGADQFNVGNQLDTQRFNIGNYMGAQQFNIGNQMMGSQMGEQARQFDAGQQGRDLEAMLGLSQAQYGAGSQQQALEQRNIDAAIHNYDQAQFNANRLLESYNSLLHGYASPSVSETRSAPGPSAASQMVGLGMAGIGAMGGRAKGGLIKKQKQGIDTLAIRKATKRARK